MRHFCRPDDGNVSSLAAAAARRLAEAGVPSPQAEAEHLLAHVLGVPRGGLVLADSPSVEERAAYERLVGRRADREPLQHLTGRVTFRHAELEVGPGVFVPRPETESVAGWVIDALGLMVEAGVAQPVVVDLYAGSGAIAAAVAGEVPQARVHAVELSPQAYTYAGRNLAGTGVDLRLGDVADAFVEVDGCVDVVVANPPYIPLDAYDGVDEEARRYDPALALWSGQDGLDAIRTVERVGVRLLRPGGLLCCEHADVQAGSAQAVFGGTDEAAGRWDQVRDHRDLVARPRWVTARRR